MSKIKNITYTYKEYWNASKPISVTNLLLAEDWNKFKVVDQCLSTIELLSTELSEVFNNDITGTLIDKTKNRYPSTSYLSTINNLCGIEALTGISSIKINNETYSDEFHLQFLSTGAELVKTFNDLTGDVSCVTGVIINGTTLSTNSVNLGNYFSNDRLVTSINNGYTGIGNDLARDGIVPTAIVISDITFSGLNNNYLINLNQDLDNKFYRKVQTISTNTYIPSNSNNYNIVNVGMLAEVKKCSGTVISGTNTFSGILDWICITDQNHNIIIPTNVKLVDGVLNLSSTVSGIIYYISNI